MSKHVGMKTEMSVLDIYIHINERTGLYVHIHASIVCHVHFLSLQRDELGGKYSICVGIRKKCLCTLLAHTDPKKHWKGEERQSKEGLNI